MVVVLEPEKADQSNREHQPGAVATTTQQVTPPPQLSNRSTNKAKKPYNPPHPDERHIDAAIRALDFHSKAARLFHKRVGKHPDQLKVSPGTLTVSLGSRSVSIGCPHNQPCIEALEAAYKQDGETPLSYLIRVSKEAGQ